jgi:hypothetical protein
MTEQTFLARLVVVWGDEERAIDAQFFGHLGIGHCMLRGVGTCAGEHLTAFVCRRDRETDNFFAFLV